MKPVLAAIFRRRRLLWSIALMLSAAGVGSWFFMPREEDPRLADRNGILVTPFPGASAVDIERLVVQPLEDELARVDDVRRVRATARAGVTVLNIELKGAVTDTDRAWDEVEDAVDAARTSFPDGVQPSALTKRIIVDQDAIVLAVTGSHDPLALRTGALQLKDALIQLSGVAEVNLEADPGEQITLWFEDAQAQRLGLSAATLAAQLQQRMQSIPGGSVRYAGRAFVVDPHSDFESMGALADTPIRLAGGGWVPLKEIASMRYGAREPREALMRLNGSRAVAVSVVPAPNLDIVQLGKRVRKAVDLIRQELEPLNIEEVSFQPDYVEERLADLGLSLALGILIIGVGLVYFMGFRLGAVVTSIVPLVAFSSLALYAVLGGVLHQIAAAALVIALGILVDSAIVVAENIQSRIDQGTAAGLAAIQAVEELALPLMTATATTLAAFVPMYAAEGNVGDFTRAIPIVIMLTLVVSYVFAILVTPTFSEMVLRPTSGTSRLRVNRIARWASDLATGRPWRVLGLTTAVLVIIGAGSTGLKRSFFPEAGRNQFVVELVMPEGSHIDDTDRASQQLEMHLLNDPGVALVSSFVGRSSPKFYYNLPQRPNAPHFAHVMVRTHAASQNPLVMARIRAFARQSLPEAQVIPRTLAQGPPLDAPIEVRLFSEDPARLDRALSSTLRAFKNATGTAHVRHDFGTGAPTLAVRIDDASASRRAISRVTLAQALYGHTRGRAVGQVRFAEDPIPLVVRDARGEQRDPLSLASSLVASPSGAFVPASDLAVFGLEMEPAVIHRRDGRRVVHVRAQLSSGFTFGEVLGDILGTLRGDVDFESVEHTLGGEAEGSGDANTAILVAAPLGVMLLLFFLLVEFNSFRKVGIVMTTVPLAAAGVVPGLLIAAQPFGFMALLGLFALVGIVVNNAIVLLDVIDRERRGGTEVFDACRVAVDKRIRPILLTTITTVAGLLPLAFSRSPLWPPMAWSMITGLLASTALTLVVVPALYTLLFRKGATNHA